MIQDKRGGNRHVETLDKPKHWDPEGPIGLALDLLRRSVMFVSKPNRDWTFQRKFTEVEVSLHIGDGNRVSTLPQALNRGRSFSPFMQREPSGRASCNLLIRTTKFITSRTCDHVRILDSKRITRAEYCARIVHVREPLQDDGNRSCPLIENTPHGFDAVIGEERKKQLQILGL